MGQHIKDTAGATHALSCDVPDREPNEVRYLQEALELIEDFQRRGSCREATEITLVERLKKNSPAEDVVGKQPKRQKPPWWSQKKERKRAGVRWEIEGIREDEEHLSELGGVLR